jgi:hypothetical protein
MMARRAHFTSFITLSHTVFVEKAPEVTFVHDYPGAVKTGIFRGSTGLAFTIVKAALKVLGPFVYIPSEESGERHLFLATSAAFPALIEQKQDLHTPSGVPLVHDGHIARGIDGKDGSGVYSVDKNCESAERSVEGLLREMMTDGSRNRVWEHTEEVFDRIAKTGGTKVKA